jgi:death-on-curing protein
VEVVYLTADQVKALHKRALESYGGLEGIRTEQQLYSAIAQPEQSVFGEDAYPTIAEKAAAYGFFIAENQPFIDGNKRTAAAALATFLDLNGYELLETSDTELAETFEDLGRKKIGQGEFFGWVVNHSRPRPEGDG